MNIQTTAHVWAASILAAVVTLHVAGADAQANGLLSYIGEYNGPIQIVAPNGATTSVDPSEITGVILVAKGPPVPEIGPAGQEAVVEEEMMEQPAEESLDTPEARRNLRNATENYLTVRAVPQLPDRPIRLTFAPVDELTQVEEEAIAGIESALVTQAIPKLRSKYRTPRMATPSKALDPVAQEVAHDILQQSIAVLPESAQRRHARTAGEAAQRPGLKGSQIRAQIPLHLLQQPPPRLPQKRIDRQVR